MAEKTIEEARKALRREVEDCESSLPVNLGFADDLMRLADAYVMAVLEEMIRRPHWTQMRARIAALGADTARQEQAAEREMVQAQMPVVNEDGGR